MPRSIRFTDDELIEIEFGLDGRPDSKKCQSAYRKISVELDRRGYPRPWVHEKVN